MMVSVIIPSYNSEKYIKETICSVIQQDYCNFEVIVVDDGSSDASSSIVASVHDIRLRFYKRPETMLKGGNSCRNLGIHHAKGEYVIFLDSDDVMAPFCLSQRMSYMRKHPELDFAVFHMTKFRKELDDGYVFTKLETKSPLEHFLGFNCLWQTSAPIFKKSFLCNIGGFNSQYKRLQDPELMTRALLSKECNFKLCSQSTPDVYFRMTEFIPTKQYKTFHALLQFVMDFYSKDDVQNVATNRSRSAIYNHLIYLYYVHGIQKDWQKVKTCINYLQYHLSIEDKIRYYICCNHRILRILRNKVVNKLMGKYYRNRKIHIWGTGA